MADNAAPPQVASKAWVVAFSVYLVLLCVLLFYLLLRLWPEQAPVKAGFFAVKLIPGLWAPNAGTEVLYLALVVVAGALGSYIHLATSFADFLGNRQFVSSWKTWYVLRPSIGAALALIVYFAARGGLISGGAGAGDLSPYGVTGLAGLAGMFSKQATDKLREVFENLFKTAATPRADPLKQPAGVAPGPMQQPPGVQPTPAPEQP